MNKVIFKIVQINREERRKAKNFMKRIKQQWDIEFPQKKRTTQNLVDNAKRFKNQSLGPAKDASIQAKKIQTGLLKLRLNY